MSYGRLYLYVNSVSVARCIPRFLHGFAITIGGGDWVQIENVHKQNDKTSAQTVTLLALNTNIKKQIKNESLQTCTKSGHLRCMSTISILQTLTSCKIAKIKAELLQNISLTHADTLNENIPSTFNYYAHSSLFKYCTTLPPANF